MPERCVRPLCLVILLLAWAIDLVTPQELVVAIIFNVPIALSSLALDSRFTRSLVGLALTANVVAGFVNGAHDGYRWDTIGLADRAIGTLSFLLVGSLSVASQKAAARAGELAGRADRAAREASVRRAIERLRASVEPERIRQALVREALGPLDVDDARFFTFDRGADSRTTYRANRARPRDVDVDRHLEPVLRSFFERVLDGAERTVTVASDDPLGRLVLERLGVHHAIAMLVAEHGSTFGVLALGRDHHPFEPDVEPGFITYVDRAAEALARAALFVHLGERNDELAVANERLRERGDVIRDLIYALSHDMRTPLAAARRTMLQAQAGAYGPLPTTYGAILTRSIAANDELERLAETLLSVSRYEAGEALLRREHLAIRSLVDGVVLELSSLWTSKGLQVSVVDELARADDVLGDEPQIRRAIINLLANAIAWTPGGRAIEIRLRYAGDELEVAIVDEGYGIPESEVPSLFQRVRSGSSPRRGAGSGLGLYLVRRIARAHGGEVTYAARAGGGSIFTLRLPRR